MTAQISAYGRLVADPQLKTTSKGTQMAMASMAVPLPCNQADDGTATMWLSVLAFGRQADALAKHHKGELVSVAGNMQVSVAGNMQVSRWTGQNGETRQGWQVIADSVISARTARPGGKKGQQGQATDALNRAKQQTGQHDDPYGDGIPF
ncbi:single-stranded DNA-binding protein [Escherichia coli]|nr:single-stranded DNA-binding protein [Escherichia coli]